MARIRTIKPEFWADEKLAPLPPVDRLVFLGLICMADDAGRLVDNVKAIDGFVFPSTHDSSRAALETLASLSRIARYTSDSGQPLIQIANWRKHQKIDRPSKHVLPGIPRRHSMNAIEDASNVHRDFIEGASMDLGPRTLDLGSGTLDLGPRSGKADLGPVVEGDGSSNEPGSAAAVAALPTSELPGVTATSYGIADLDAINERMADAMRETPAQSPNGALRPDTRSGGTPDPYDRPDNPASAPSPTDLVLPVAAVKFGRTFYQRGVATDARRSDVFAQLLAVLKPEGLAFNGSVIRVTPARLSSACLAVLKTHEKQPLEDADAALPYLLVKLSDVSQDSPTEAAQTEAKRVEVSDQLTFAERKAIADKIATEHPAEAAQIELDAVKLFPGKVKEMQQPRESYRISRLLKLAEGTDA